MILIEMKLIGITVLPYVIKLNIYRESKLYIYIYTHSYWQVCVNV